MRKRFGRGECPVRPEDWYGDYQADAVTDPVGPATGEGRVLRGGSWLNGARGLRSAYRNADDPGDRLGDIGFRLALGPELKQGKQDR
jgi:formylglycine-generating enzyme required for sulfatase activity